MGRTSPGNFFQQAKPAWIFCMLISWIALALAAGCSVGGRAPITVRQYTLEYAPPFFGEVDRLGESICIEPFSAVRNYRSTSMVFRAKPFLYGDDSNHRWRVKPRDMVSDLLSRDMRNANLFKGVFSPCDGDNPRYFLSGIIEEFYEMEDATGPHAVLAVNVSLLDFSHRETAERIVFQKGYRSMQPMKGRDAESLAMAMSRAMENLSRLIITDTYRAIRTNGEDGKRASLFGR